MNETHNDGMSSDDEVPDVELAQYREQLGECENFIGFKNPFWRLNVISAQLKSDAAMIFDEVVEEFCELPQILHKFDEWKQKDINAYKEAYVHLCLPKIVSIFMRSQMILWSPFEPDHYEDIDKMKWFHPVAMYGRTSDETEAILRIDPDVFMIPTVIEKIILPKLSSKFKTNSTWDQTKLFTFFRAHRRMLGSAFDNWNLQAGETAESANQWLSIVASDIEESSKHVYHHHR